MLDRRLFLKRLGMALAVAPLAKMPSIAVHTLDKPITHITASEISTRYHYSDQLTRFVNRILLESWESDKFKNSVGFFEMQNVKTKSVKAFKPMRFNT